ncbi:MAG TPA: LacI family DNA-binding transcriptional regulator [Clostridia bacterium]|nr:LacI family DNA-binding transcriptional regulator [Clostridia bacterium]
MTTIEEVAKKAKVSTATVSRVINKNGPVSEKTRQKVMKTIDQLGYAPNTLARNFRTRKTNTIITVLHDICNPVMAEMIKGMEDVAYKNDYCLLIGNSGSNPDRAMDYIKALREKKADGVIFITPRINEDTIIEINKVVPVVLVSDYIENSHIPSVRVDDYNAAYKMTEYLINNSHKKIAYIAGPQNIRIAADRLKGFKAALEDHRLNYDGSLVIMDNSSFEDGYRSMGEILSNTDVPVSVVVYNDETAIGALEYAKEKGYRIPEEIAVAGFDNIGMAGLVKPRLTTVNQPKYEIGAMSMEIMLGMLQGMKPECEDNILDYQLIIRESCEL